MSHQNLCSIFQEEKEAIYTNSAIKTKHLKKKRRMNKFKKQK